MTATDAAAAGSDSYGAVIFHSTSAAIRADKTLRKAQVDAKLIPTPREISSDCGLAIRIAWELKDEVTALLTDAGVEIDGIYPL